MTKIILSEEQRESVAKKYYLIKEIMDELHLTENDVEDWHGFFAELLCLQVTYYWPDDDEFIKDKLKSEYEFKYIRCRPSMSVEVTPMGLMGL